MNKKGFTLVELLSVIALLLLISAVIFPSLSAILSKNKNKISTQLATSLENSAQIYVEDKELSDTSIDAVENGNLCVTLDELIEVGLIDNPIIDPSTKKEVVLDDYVIKVSKSGNSYKYEYTEKDLNCKTVQFKQNDDEYYEDLNEGSTNNILLNDPNIPIVPDDTSNANNPELGDYMIPVVYSEEENTWIATTTKRWYNYSKQQWANAVTVKEEYRDNWFDEYGQLKKEKLGEKINVKMMNSMWVWIPRYEYRKNAYKYLGGESKDNLGKFDIRFINKEQTNPTNSSFVINEAFTFGDKELAGFWMSKFDAGFYDDNTTHTINNFLIRPDCEAITSNNPNTLNSTNFVQTYFNAAHNMTADQNVYGFTTSVDTHLIKNTEWGAVIYLAYSDYGFKGNKKFNLEEIYTNNSKTTHITGRSSGGESDNFQYGNYGYNGYKCNNTTYATNCYTTGELSKGTGASSTSNIYGVYDLFNSTSSGPLVMIAYKSKLYETIDIPTWSGSVSNPYPDKKYYDEYIYDSRNNNNYYVDNKKYGDATWESFDAQIISTRQSPRDMGYYLHRSGHPLNYSFKNSVSSFAYLRVVLVNN